MKPDYPWLGLVIQGPIISKGRMPLAAKKPHHNVTDEDIVVYNSENNVKELLAKSKNLFGQCVCVTWDTEDLTRLSDEVRFGHVFPISDNLPTIPGRSELLPSNNKLRQFYSTYKGIQKIQALNGSITHVIKIRTDQQINLELLCSEFSLIAEVAENGKYIVTPGYVEGMISGLHDFYLGGEINEMLCLFKSYCERSFQYSYSVHTDLFAHAAFTWQSSNFWEVPFYSYFLKDNLYSPRTPSQYSIALDMWKYHVRCWPSSIWEGLLWRGYPTRGIFSVHESALPFLTEQHYANITHCRNSLRLLWISLESTNWKNYSYACKKGFILYYAILVIMTIKTSLKLASVSYATQSRRLSRIASSFFQ